MNPLLLRSTPPSRRRRRTLRAAVLSLLVALCAAPSAAFASGEDVVADCAEDSKLEKTYTASEYKAALKDIPTDVDEYTDCRDVIRRAQLAAAGGGSSSGGDGSGAAGGTGSGSTGGASPGAPATPGVDGFEAALAGASPEERAAVIRAVGTAAPISVAGKELRPDTLSNGDLGTLNSLPGPFVLVLILLALGTVAATTPTLISVVRTRRQRPIA